MGVGEDPANFVHVSYMIFTKVMLQFLLSD